METDLGGKVVRKICDGLEGKHHCVYFDNYFYSYALEVDLREKQVYACGTVNASRKHLPELKADNKLQRGESDYRISDNEIASYS